MKTKAILSIRMLAITMICNGKTFMGHYTIGLPSLTQTGCAQQDGMYHQMMNGQH